MIAIDKYISGGVLDYIEASKDFSISQDFLDEFATYYQYGGGIIKNHSSSLAALSFSSKMQIPSSAAPASNCQGRSGFQSFPPVIYLNSCQASALQGALTAGAGVAGIAALLTSFTGVGTAVAGAIAAGLTIYAGLYTICGSWGKGIKLFPSPVVTVACWSQ